MSRTKPARSLYKGRGLLLLLFLLPLSLQAQKLDDRLRFAEEAKAEGEHYEAVKHLQKAEAMAPEQTKVRYKLAQAYRRSHLYEEALEQYQKVYEEDRRGERFPECLRWLAEMQEYVGDYRGAKRSWGNLKRRYMRERENPLYQLAEQRSRACDWAQEAMKEEARVEVEREEFPINTTGSEFAPYILQDSLFYFSTLRAEEENQDGSIEGPEPKARILKARSVAVEKEGERSGVGEDRAVMETEWSEPEPLEGPWDEAQHMANSSFCDSGRTLIFSRCEEQRGGKKECRLFRSQKEDGTWKEAEPLPHPVNNDSFNTTHPMLGKMEKQEVLFFSSNRPGGKGKMDIWWVERNGLGDYGEPKNAGDSINTPRNEVTPFFMELEQKLYFASDWHEGFGGYDIFRSTKGEKGFAHPENLGRSVNSSYNDLYPFIDEERNTGFFASNRKGSREGWVGICCNDIYRWPVTIEPRVDTVKELSSVEDLNRFLPVTLYFHNDRPDPRTRDTTTELSYDASYRDYKERVPTYIDRYTKGLSGPEKDSSTLRMKRFFDEKVDGGMQDLRLFAKLLLKELRKGQDIELSIKGYASPLAETQYNVNLTKRRINSLINFLREYKGGVYIPYIEDEASDGGSLSFLLKPYGEYSADSVVSDELADQRESVYSVSAGLERKIEIERVKQIREDSSYAELELEKGVHDFGHVRADSSYSYRFVFSNKGADSLRIDSVKSDQEGLRPELKDSVLAPGEKGEISVTLHPTEESGKQVRSFRIFCNGVTRMREASVTYELEDQR